MDLNGSMEASVNIRSLSSLEIYQENFIKLETILRQSLFPLAASCDYLMLCTHMRHIFAFQSTASYKHHISPQSFIPLGILSTFRLEWITTFEEKKMGTCANSRSTQQFLVLWNSPISEISISNDRNYSIAVNKRKHFPHSWRYNG